MSICCRSVLLGVLVIFYLQSCVKGPDASVTNGCCFSFFTKPIPLSVIVNYKKTSHGCLISGVVFTTKKTTEVCVDPNQSWVEQAMKEIDERHLKSTEEVLPGPYTKARTQTVSTTTRPNLTTDLHGRETEAQTQTVSTTTRPNPTTDLHGRETEAQTQTAPETLRPDPAEPIWFSKETAMTISCRSVLLGLLVIFYLQSCVEGQAEATVMSFCFKTRNSTLVCVDPGLTWVKQAMQIIDQRVLEGIHPVAETTGPKTTPDTHGHIEAQSQPVPKTTEPEKTADERGQKTEAQTQPLPETSRPDTNEPNQFCRI
ncbi:uncharacterized protein [Salminus brasiliensis]|uniref:uncharacterized protein n=1 Tax=Salminus brasiliensis TaxID=930266 RepID=UPI003B832F72